MKQEQLCMIEREGKQEASARSLLKDYGEDKGFQSTASFKNWEDTQFAENWKNDFKNGTFFFDWHLSCAIH